MVLRSGHVAWNPSLGTLRLLTLSCDVCLRIWFGTNFRRSFRLESSTWDLSLGMFRLGLSAWDL